MSGGTVVVVDPDDTRRELVAFALGAHTNYRIEPVSTTDAARAFLAFRNDLIAVICDARTDAQDGYQLLREVRSHERAARVTVILLCDPAEQRSRAGDWIHGADAVLNSPVDAAELVVCLEHFRNERNPRVVIADSAVDADGGNQIALLLATLLDAAHPGMLRRADDVAALALDLADDFDVVPELLGDFHHAAMLHQLARLTEPTTAWEVADAATFSRLLASSARLVEEIPALAGTAELIAGMGAHWDGSGIPFGVDRGAIPVRSRILRVATDFFRYGTTHPDVVVDVLSLHANTLYDPAVVSSLGAVVKNRSLRRAAVHRETVPLDRLTEGQILAIDLCTASGVKLLSAGSVLTAASLRVIRERHAADPLVHVIPTQRRVM